MLLFRLTNIFLISFFFLFLKTDNKKSDTKGKSKPNTDNGVNETITTGGEASATVNEEHHHEGIETSDEIMESKKTEHGNQ
jgi:hypothetical protein